MSSGQLARTPANFPRMKHRAAGRILKRWAKQRFEIVSMRLSAGIMSVDEARQGMGLPMMWIETRELQA